MTPSLTGPRALPWALVVCCLLVMSCSGLSPTKVGDIVENPRHYDGKVVTISGDVIGTLNALVVRGYTVRDATGELLVVTDRAVPHQGEKVRVRGRVNQAFLIGDRELLVLVEGVPPVPGLKGP